MTLETIIGVFL